MLRLTFLRAAAAVALAAALCLVAPARAADPVLSKNVPGDAIVYIGWQGSEALQAKYDKSNLKHIVDASKVPAWIDEKSGWALEQIKKESPEAEAGVKVALSVGAKMWKHPTALYVGPFDMSKVDKDTPPTPRIALICQAGADADALIKEVQPLIDQAKDSPVKLAIKKAGDKIVFTVGEFTPAQQVTLGIFEGAVNMRTVPLTNANEFKAAMAEVDADAALSAYIDMQALAGQRLNLIGD